MADEFDRRIMPDFLQTTFVLSLGAAYRSCQMLRNPADSASKLFDEAKVLFTMPEDSGNTLQDKFQAIAGLWMEKGATLMTDFRNTGEKFAEGAEGK